MIGGARGAGAALAAALMLVAAGSSAGRCEEPPVMMLAQASAGAPKIAVAPSVAARPASNMPLRIDVGPADALPRHSFVQLRGLHPSIAPSVGYSIAPGAWAVPLFGLSELKLNIPAGVSGNSELSVSLMKEDGTPLAEAKTTLEIAAPVKAAAPPPSPQPPAPTPAVRPERNRAAADIPVLTPEDRQRAEALTKRGEGEMQSGNIVFARQFFLRSAQMGLPRAALLLAATYDPRELQRMRARGVLPDVDEARKWYERALELGAPEAKERLANLGGG
jgi:hypothetical protein